MREAALALVVDNWPQLKARGIYEPCLWQALTVCKTNFRRWNLTLLRELWTRSAWLAAALAATLALGLQTDVIGVHWLAVVLWGLCGAAVGREYDRES